MDRENWHSTSVGKQHRAQMSDCRGAINSGPGNDMAPAAFPSLAGTTGEKNGCFAGSSSFVARKVGVLECEIADQRDVVHGSNRARLDAACLAIAPVCANGLELMAENIKRKRLEQFRLRPVDKCKNLLVDGHRVRTHHPAGGMIMALAHQPIQSCDAATFLLESQKCVYLRGCGNVLELACLLRRGQPLAGSQKALQAGLRTASVIGV